MTNSYVRFVSSFMHPQPTHLPYGYKAEEGRVPFDRINALGLLLHPLRRPLVAAGTYQTTLTTLNTVALSTILHLFD